VATVRSLLLQSYRLTQQHLLSRGIQSVRHRVDTDFDALVDGDAVKRIVSFMAKRKGPYARAKRQTAWIVNTVVILAPAFLLPAIAELMLSL
jgi:hypothetical protein